MTDFKKYVIVSNWCYPFGGGEEFMMQTTEWMTKNNYKCYWISFCKANNKPHEKFMSTKTPTCTMINLTGDFDEKKVYLWLRLIKPHIVHHQGGFREEIFNACNLLRINFVSGYHFWTGAILLDSATGNCNILENASKHKCNEELLRLYKQPLCTLYTVSPFVKECIHKICNIDLPNMVFSGSSQSRYKCDYMNKQYVTCINIHKIKGGEILLEIMKQCPEIPFIAVQTEHMSEDLDSKIEELIDEHNLNPSKTIKSIYMKRTENPKELYSKTKILLAPSLCDETFCRTVNEAMMNGIPVVTTGAGNIKYLVGEKGLMCKTIDEWVKEVKKLYNLKNSTYYDNQVKYHFEQYKLFSEDTGYNMFMELINRTISQIKNNNIMIITPWCDQGLGIQSRNYFNILNNVDIYKNKVFIFSVKPYNADTAQALQKDPSEWNMAEVYYSPNDREHISEIELREFVTKYNIGKCLIPETCFPKIFEVAKYLKTLDVFTYAIPNIEIVQKKEVFKHQYFHKILCNNYLCQKIFNDHGIMSTKYVGYGMADQLEYRPKAIMQSTSPVAQKPKGKNRSIPITTNDVITSQLNFLFIGGMNAFSRKHILDICEGFRLAYESNKNIKLTCTVQKTNLLEIELINKIDEYKTHPGITIIENHLKYEDIFNLYYNNDISIQVSKHEGLGLGFYEALYTGTPVITLNTAPHNEIIKDGVNGWIINCTYKKMTDNKDPIFDSAYFNPQDLCNKILEICSNKKKLLDLYKSLKVDLDDRLSLTTFKKHFLEGINE